MAFRTLRLSSLSLPLFFFILGLGCFINSCTPVKVVRSQTTEIKNEVKEEVKKEDPSLEEFVSVDVEPHPLQSIESMVVYPVDASRAGLQGSVTIAALVGLDGSVEKVEVLKSDFRVFNQPAIDAIMKVKFTPARSKGRPVKVWYTVPIRFRLQRDD